MLVAIEEMKYFLRTAYGYSKKFRGSKIQVKFQGLCQGNETAQGTDGNLAAILFMDDTDVIHLDVNKQQTVYEAHRDLQESIPDWGNLLRASGDTLKPVKCCYYIIFFKLKSNSKWEYAANEKDKEIAFGVPTLEEGFEEIELVGVNVAKKTLGVYLCPTGDTIEQLMSIFKKV